jgi:endonuclease/exonuclease/phosphatase family metal-dependent hydrolase
MLHAGEQRGLLVTRIDLDGTELVFMATHLDFRPDPAERLANVEELKQWLAQHPGEPAIVAGDFNDHPGGAVHQAMKAAFTDAWETAGTGDGFTFSSETPKSRIDYIYIRREAPWEAVRAEVVPSLASDHLPLWIELHRRPRRAR